MHKCGFALESYRRCRRADTRPHACMYARKHAVKEHEETERTLETWLLSLRSTHLVSNCVVSFVLCNTRIPHRVRHLFIKRNARETGGSREGYKSEREWDKPKSGQISPTGYYEKKKKEETLALNETYGYTDVFQGDLIKIVGVDDQVARLRHLPRAVAVQQGAICQLT